MNDATRGLADLLRSRATAEPDRLFARFAGTPLTLAELDRGSSAFARFLRERGIRSGERVAVMMRNGIETLQVVFGLAKAGVVWVPVNAQQRGEGLRYLLSHAAPRLLVVDAAFEETVAEAFGGPHATPERLTHGGADGGDLSAILAGEGGFAEPAPALDAAFAIMYTSGTTGRPKGVIVTHRMLVTASLATAHVADLRSGDVFFVWEPLYHIGGAQLLALPLLNDVVLGMVERFSASRFWDEVRREGATHIHHLGGILQILLKQPVRENDRDHPVRISWGGGCPGDTWVAFRDRFGVEIRECYGMTEASSITTVNANGLVGSVGQPVPWLAVEIRDEAGTILPAGERGEIVVRGLQEGVIFPGYLDNPEATAKALRGGALHTGDLGSFDEAGNLFFHGRMTDSVRCRGENVSAYEVEHVAAQHPAVEDCAIIGVAAEIGEQDIKLFVKPKAGSTIEPGLLGAWLQQRLATYQVPRYIAIVDEFERTASQRIMKHRLSPRTDDCWDRFETKERTA